MLNVYLYTLYIKIKTIIRDTGWYLKQYKVHAGRWFFADHQPLVPSAGSRNFFFSVFMR